ncbi:MAG: hypothetical protein R3B07_01160 [Polyangiaceae bacterium]
MDAKGLKTYVEGRIVNQPEVELVAIESYSNPGAATHHAVAVLRHLPSALLLHFVRGGEVRLGLDERCRREIELQLEDIGSEEGLEVLDSIPPPQKLILRDFCITPTPLTEAQLAALVLPLQINDDEGYASVDAAGLRSLNLQGLALPTASELEYAALGGNLAAFFWGNDLPEVERWNEFPAERNADATNGYGLTDVLAYREWCVEGADFRVKGGAADLYPWQSSEGLLMLPSLTERPEAAQAAMFRLVFRLS